MKILHVIDSLSIGGAQRLLADLLPIFNDKGCEVTLLVLKSENTAFTETIQKSGVPIISLDLNSYKSPSCILKLRSIMKDFDIVHAHLFPVLYFVAIASLGLKTKLIWTEHNTSNRRRGKWYFRIIERYIYSKFQKIISISLKTQELLQQWLNQQDDRFIVINNGVNTSSFSSVHRSVLLKSLIMISRFAPQKDQETVIRAMQMIDKEAIVRFVGDGENLEHCKQVARECCVEDRVQFLGARSDVAELVSESYIGIQSSNWEGFGLTAVEIMSCGKPVIASDVDGLKQVVEGAGIIFKKGDAKELADKVNALLYDGTLYKQYSEQCSKRALEYDIHVMAEKYLEVYKSLD